VEADIQSVLLLKQSALNYSAILPNINLVASELELTAKYEFTRKSLYRRMVESEKAFCSSCNYLFIYFFYFIYYLIQLFTICKKTLKAFLEHVYGVLDMNF
jgi:hypothetical protein